MNILDVFIKYIYDVNAQNGIKQSLIIKFKIQELDLSRAHECTLKWKVSPV